VSNQQRFIQRGTCYTPTVTFSFALDGNGDGISAVVRADVADTCSLDDHDCPAAFLDTYPGVGNSTSESFYNPSNPTEIAFDLDYSGGAIVTPIFFGVLYALFLGFAWLPVACDKRKQQGTRASARVHVVGGGGTTTTTATGTITATAASSSSAGVQTVPVVQATAGGFGGYAGGIVEAVVVGSSSGGGVGSGSGSSNNNGRPAVAVAVAAPPGTSADSLPTGVVVTVAARQRA
jgi:hypothetical protein